MASKPLRPCLHPSCTALVRSGYCERHRPPRVERRSEDSRRWRRWYSLPVWTDDLRPEQLAREPFCRECAAHGLSLIHISFYSKCSKCGKMAVGKRLFCPNCGAPMTDEAVEMVEEQVVLVCDDSGLYGARLYRGLSLIHI